MVLTRLVSELNAEMLLRLCCECCCCSSFCNHYNNDNSKNNVIIVRNGNVGREVESRGRLGQRGEEIDRVASLSQVAHSRGVRVCERAFCPVTYPGRTRYPDMSIRNSAHQQLGQCASNEFPTPETVKGMGFRRTDF